MKKRKYTLQKDFTLLSFSLFTIVAAWIIFTIYGIYATSTINDTLEIQIMPINGTFNQKSIDLIKRRISILPKYTNASDSAQEENLDTIQSVQPQPTSEFVPNLLEAPINKATPSGESL